jgi:C1A family cysteine protease
MLPVRTLARSVLGRKGTGWRAPLPEHVNPRRDLDKLGVPSSDLPSSYSLKQWSSVLDQGPTESCVVHAWTQAHRGAEWMRNKNGPPPPLRSRLFGYYNSRAIHGEQKIDGGTYTSTCVAAAARLGCPPEVEWPFSTRAVNKQPSVNSYRLAHDLKKFESPYRIFEEGHSRFDAVKSALAADYMVIFGTRIDSAFKSRVGPTRIGVPAGPYVGGHAMCIVGYDNDSRTVEVINSWGTGWRDAGYFKMEEEWLAWERLSDLQVVRLLP